MTTTQQTQSDLPAGHEPVVLAELVGASKQFGKGSAAVHAVRGLDLQVRSGELLAVLGPNGAGKSTAIGMLTGLTAPTSGTARLFGRDPRDVRARRRLGVMLQASGVPATLRVRELLTAFRGYYPAPLSMDQVVSAAGTAGTMGWDIMTPRTMIGRMHLMRNHIAYIVKLPAFIVKEIA